MSNFKPLLKQELLRHLYSLKFITMSVFAVVFGIVCVYIQLLDFQDRKQTYDGEVLKSQGALESVKFYSKLNIPIIIEPNPLSIFCKGEDAKIGNKINISLKEVPQFENTSQIKNPFLAIFDSMDLVTLIQIIFSVMTLFLVADSIAGEREEGTLRQIFANRVLRTQYFWAKFLGSLIILAIPLVLIFLLTNIIFLMTSFISLQAIQWLQIILIFGCCLAFISVYILIGLVVSARSSSAVQSVLFGLLIWIILIFIYPVITRYVVSQVVEVPTSDYVNQQIEQQNTEIREQVEAARPERTYGSFSCSHCDMGGFYGLHEIVAMSSKAVLEFVAEHLKRAYPLILKGQEDMYRQLLEVKQRYIWQRTIATRFVQLLPGTLLEESASKIAGTHFTQRDLAILQQAKQYRDTIIEYLKSKNGFGFEFFTRIPPEDMKDNYEDYIAEELKQYSPDNLPPLDFSDSPVFTLTQKSIVPVESLLDLALLLVLNIIFFIFGGYWFARADVRARG
jgi:ABC-type transport system involved in multi-copper enzyme maturation permease subunit